MRLIDADDVLRSMKQFRDVREKDMEMTGSRGTGCSWDDAVTIIKRTPTVEPNMAQVLAYECGKDSVSVVRCKDCKHYVIHILFGHRQGWCERLCDEYDKSLARGTEDNDFCSKGERRSEWTGMRSE